MTKAIKKFMILAIVVTLSVKAEEVDDMLR